MRREKLKAKSHEFLKKEKEKLAKWRTNIKQDKEHYDKFKENNKFKKWVAKKNKEKEVIVPEAVNAKVPAQEGKSTQTPGSAFPCRQTLHWNLSRADCQEPKVPIKNQRSYKGWEQSTDFESICSKIVEDLARS